uniref:Uncharacterized protein n=1 Tax=Arundo donax TaxID=35708 RepID=A0A0A8YMQ6_ARUDO
MFAPYYNSKLFIYIFDYVSMYKHLSTRNKNSYRALFL